MEAMERLLTAIERRCPGCTQTVEHGHHVCPSCGASLEDEEEGLNFVAGSSTLAHGPISYMRLRASLDALQEGRIAQEDAVGEARNLHRMSQRGLEQLQCLAPASEREQLAQDGLEVLLDCCAELDRLLGLLLAYESSLCGEDWPSARSDLLAIGGSMSRLQALYENIGQELSALKAEDQASS